jgi:hypothetical protein
VIFVTIQYSNEKGGNLSKKHKFTGPPPIGRFFTLPCKPRFTKHPKLPIFKENPGRTVTGGIKQTRDLSKFGACHKQ